MTPRGLLLSAAKAYGLSPRAIAPELGPISDAPAAGIDWASVDPHSLGRIYERQVPLGRGCTVPDIMKAVYYILEQDYETGQAYNVTGGQEMR